jgi:hypothetical protein
VLSVSSAGFYVAKQRRSTQHAKMDAQLRALVQGALTKAKARNGSPRMQRARKEHGVATTHSAHETPLATNHPVRDFAVGRTLNWSDSRRHSAARRRARTSLGSRQSLHESRLPRRARGARHNGQYRSSRRLLGQRRRRELRRNARVGTVGGRAAVHASRHDARAGGVHRWLVQSRTVASLARVSFAQGIRAGSASHFASSLNPVSTKSGEVQGQPS